jgi:hypothetical protein
MSAEGPLTGEAVLRAAADALEKQPPKLRAQYVAALRLYADEPWRLESAHVATRAAARTAALSDLDAIESELNDLYSERSVEAMARDLLAEARRLRAQAERVRVLCDDGADLNSDELDLARDVMRALDGP